MPALALELLGDFRLTLDGKPVKTVVSARLQSFLAYLVLHRHAPQIRSQVAFALWPDRSEVSAKNNLRQLLFELRSALPNAETFLLSDRQTIQWNPDAPCTLDVAELETALQECERLGRSGDLDGEKKKLEQVSSLYRGDLLPSCYDDWIAPERERLREGFIQALERLVALLERGPDYEAAIRYSHALLRHDPVREESYRCLMRLYSFVGDRAGALRTYHTCATVLGRELDVPPGPATQQQYQELLNLNAAASRPAAALAQPALVGRKVEWTRLERAWNAAAAGQAALVGIQGEAGIGKTRLAEEFLRWAERHTIPTASARCYAAEGVLPFAPVTAWLRARPLPPLDDGELAQVVHLLPEIIPRLGLAPAPIKQEWQQQHLFKTIAHVLLGTGRLLLFLDDLQWADPETLALVCYLFRFDPHARFMLLATIRAEETAHRDVLESALLALKQTGQFVSVELGPLNGPETRVLANTVLGRTLDEALGQRVFQETEGNPLFIVEMTRALAQGEEQLPPKVQAAIGARLSHLSPEARELAQVAAIIGREFEIDVLARATDLPGEKFVRALDELWHNRVVRERGESYDFSHGKLRTLIASELSAVRSRWLHARVAGAIETSHAGNLDAVSGEVAAHYDQAGRVEAAARYYERAARSAQSIFANEQAIVFYHRALALSHDGPAEQRARLNQGLGDVLKWVGRNAEARDVYHFALTHSPNLLSRARLYRKIELTWEREQNTSESFRALDAAWDTLDEVPNGLRDEEWWHEWIAIQLRRMEMYYYLGMWRDLEHVSQDARQIVEEKGTPAQRVELVNRLAQVIFRRERYLVPQQAVDLRRMALDMVRASGDEHDLANAHFGLGFALLWHGDLDTAAEQFRISLNAAARSGDAGTELLALIYLGVAERRRGNVPETHRLATEALGRAQEVNAPFYIGMAYANLAWVAWRDGNWREAQEKAERAMEAWCTARHYPLQWAALLVLVALALDRDDLSNAVALAQALLAPPQMRFPPPLESALQKGADAESPPAVRDSLRAAVEMARQMGYL